MTTIVEVETDPVVAAPTRFSVNLRQSGIYIAFAAIVVLFEILTSGALLEPQNISNIVVQNSYILILAIGMILIIIAGHIDLSAGSVVAVTGAVAAVLMVDLDVPWPLAILATLVVGALIGAWQGFWIAYFGIPAFIVTLAGMLVFRALTMTVLGNQGIGPFPDDVRTLANGFTPASSTTSAWACSAARISSRCSSASPPSPASSSCSGGPAAPASATARPSTHRWSSA